MADLLVHYAAGRLVGLPLRDPVDKAAVALGALLPDLLTKTLMNVFHSGEEFAQPTHSLAGLAIACAFAATMFTRPVFVWLYAGALTHLILDALKSDMLAPYGALLFPFSDAPTCFPVYRSVDSVYALPVALLVIAAIEIFEKRRVQQSGLPA